MYYCHSHALTAPSSYNKLKYAITLSYLYVYKYPCILFMDVEVCVVLYSYNSVISQISQTNWIKLLLFQLKKQKQKNISISNITYNGQSTVLKSPAAFFGPSQFTAVRTNVLSSTHMSVFLF